MNLIESDLGRPVSHITQNFTGVDLAADAENRSQEPLAGGEGSVRPATGGGTPCESCPIARWTTGSTGLVVTFSDVTRLKEVENNLRYEKTYSESIVETVRHPLLVLDEQLRVLSANRAVLRDVPGRATESG